MSVSYSTQPNLSPTGLVARNFTFSLGIAASTTSTTTVSTGTGALITTVGTGRFYVSATVITSNATAGSATFAIWRNNAFAIPAAGTASTGTLLVSELLSSQVSIQTEVGLQWVDTGQTGQVAYYIAFFTTAGTLTVALLGTSVYVEEI